MAKPKHYIGDIPFNIWGDQLHYPEHDYPRDLSADEWDGKTIRIARLYEGAPEVVTDNPFRHDQLGLIAHEAPQKGRYGGDERYVAQIAKGVIWLPNYTFEDVLVYDTYSRGRSAAYFHFTSKTTKRGFTVFLKDFEDGFVRRMERGEVSGRFTFCKRGSNYGTTMVR